MRPRPGGPPPGPGVFRKTAILVVQIHLDDHVYIHAPDGSIIADVQIVRIRDSGRAQLGVRTSEANIIRRTGTTYEAAKAYRDRRLAATSSGESVDVTG